MSHFVEPSPGDWLARMETAFAACLLDLPSGRGVALEPLLAAGALVKEGYAVLYSEGMISRTLSDDLQHNLTKVKEHAAAAVAAGAGAVGAAPGAPQPTVRMYLEGELAASGGSAADAKGRAGVQALLWLTRTLRFVARMLQLLGEAQSREIAEAGRMTYDEILHPYHGPLLGVIVGMAFSWAPRRKTLVDTMHARDRFDEHQGAVHLKRAADAMAPVVNSMHALLLEKGCDYPDRVGV